MAIAQRLLISMSCEASTLWTLPAIVLLGFLVGIVSSYPIPSRTNATLLEKRWETMFSRSILGLPGEKSNMNWENDYLLGIKRVRKLYCNVGIGFHLQVLPDGRINGVHNDNQYSLIEISTVERGVVSLYGVKSGLFVAMSSRGRLYGTEEQRVHFPNYGYMKSSTCRVPYRPLRNCSLSSENGMHLFWPEADRQIINALFHKFLIAVFRDECKFKETLLPNNYNAYESSVYSRFYIALSKHGRAKRGNKATTAVTVTHFLPRI